MPDGAKKCPLALARDAWLASEEGQRCSRGHSVGVYLQNRLEAAFIAGWDACEANHLREATEALASHGIMTVEEYLARHQAQIDRPDGGS